jgi:dTDP-4-amino-4,6-dideoxygalactose transaminase
LRRQYALHRRELDAAMAAVCESAAFIDGPDVAAFEGEFAAFCGASHCVGVSSGGEALRLALAALGVGSGDEVILPANTFIATALAVSATGARPVLVDCLPDTANIDPAQVDAAVTERTRAIIAVHLYGQPADVDALQAVADRYGIPLVEDAAQAHGAEFRGRRCGGLGRLAAFSFYPGKNLGAFGDAGAVTTNDEGLASFVREARSYGERRKYEHVVKGGNWRLDTLQAAVLRVKLRHLDEWNSARRRAAALYHERLRDVRGVVLPQVRADVVPVWHLYVIETEQRDALLAVLRHAQVFAGIHYPVPIHSQPAFADLGYARGAFPQSERRAGRILSLPIFPEITEAEIDRVAGVVREFAGGG